MAGLRARGLLPAVAYNRERNLSIAVDRKQFDRIFREVSTHGLVELDLDGELLPAVVKAVQMDKRLRIPQHADFYLVTYGQELEVPVPVHPTGRAKGVIEGGILDVLIHNLPIFVPGPRFIPQALTVDVTALETGQVIPAGDIPLPAGCRLGIDPHVAVITILPPQKMAEAQESAPAAEPA